MCKLWRRGGVHTHALMNGCFTVTFEQAQKHTPFFHALQLGWETESLVKILQFMVELRSKFSHHHLSLY